MLHVLPPPPPPPPHLPVSQATYVVYGTRSACEMENGSVVSKALDGHRTAVERKEVTREFALLPPRGNAEEGTGYNLC